MDLQGLVNQTIEDKARAIYSKLDALTRQMADPKDVFEELVSWGPGIGELLKRHHRDLGITEQIAPSGESRASSGDEQKDQDFDASSQQSGKPSFPAVHSKHARPTRPRKKAQSAEND